MYRGRALRSALPHTSFKMLFQDLFDQIKAESRLKEGDDFDTIIVNLINELFKEAVMSDRPMELRTGIKLAVQASTGIVSLPNDFLIHHEVIFLDVNTGREWPLSDADAASQPAPRGMYGHPKSFEVITNEKIIVQPSNLVITGDQILLLYYKIPLILTTENLSIPNPIVRLEPFITRAAIRRLRMFHSDDVQVAQMLGGDIASASQAYSKDEPERTPRSDSGGN